MKKEIKISYRVSVLLVGLCCLFLSNTLLAQNGYLYNRGIFHVTPGGVLTVKSNFTNQATGRYTNDGKVLMEGNFHNEGVTTFTEEKDGYTRFQGTQETQEIAGAVGADFKHVLFDNPNAVYSFYLSGAMHIFGEANFYRGIIDNHNYGGKLVFEQDGYAIGTSDRSHVHGEVHKFGDNSFVFPIGKERMYRPGGMIQLGETPTAFAATYYAYNSNVQYPHAQRIGNVLSINDKEFWTIEETTNNGEVLIDLTWDDRITPFRLLQDLESLAIVAWDSEANRWVSLGGSVDVNESRVTSVWEGQAYKVFTLGTVENTPDREDLFIYNAVNPNDTGGNEYFKIIGIEKFPDNRVRIYNRWGVLVFETKQYDTNNNVFRGISQGRVTIQEGEELPIGTYFYILDYVTPDTGKSKSIQGYLYLNR